MANLTAEMTVGKPRVHLRSFQDIIDNEITIYVKGGTISDTYFADAQEGTLKDNVNKNYVDRETFKFNDDAVAEIVENPKAAYFHTLLVFVKYGTKVLTLPNFDGRINGYVGIGLQKNSELTAVFDYHIMTMRQTGLLDDMYAKHLMKDQPEDDSDRIFQEDILVLGFDNLFLPANIMGIGMICAVVILICEKLTSGKRVQETHHGPMSGLSDNMQKIKA